jgi:hydroxymethylbilane synthase
MRLKLGSRKSDLARWQAVQVGRVLEQLPEKPSIEFIFKSSLGDQNLDVPLAGMGAKGVFTEDFHADLTGGQCDLVVHSWKDLPVETRPDTHIAMTLPRADVRDLILIPEQVWQQAVQTKQLTVLTSSPRRVYNLAPVLPKLLPHKLEIKFENVRGNVPTRLRKMHESGTALILAKAGLDRLLAAEADGFLQESVRTLIQKCRFQVLPVSLNPPAPAQGALAVEVLRANEQLNAICAKLTDEVTANCVEMEREVLREYGGGCHQKIGVAVLPRNYGVVRALRGVTDQGETLQEWRIENTTEWTKAVSKVQVHPHSMKDNFWFERQPVETTQAVADEEAFFVARADAWPLNWQPKADQVLWTAGIQTWTKLAERGLFVNGCNDGLGENEAPNVDHIKGQELHWCKLSHTSAPPAERGLATYRLIPRENHPDLRGKTHFFWASRTQFERAQKLYPEEILNGHHACGPGHTYEHLKSLTNLRYPVKVFMGLEQFLNETLPNERK